uniref:Uncharacterized protein n=1 Tax=Eutreptiella gymnastica TaxID=73025 RepID=A0A7S4CZG8_9EUGL|mmetsp:Transcript_23225/g.37024  ORF Transcript_23225/g.37024 Transcript_23225/m.37024 type:complete len:213 (-) Transcript_23225:404-1042(-)
MVRPRTPSLVFLPMLLVVVVLSLWELELMPVPVLVRVLMPVLVVTPPPGKENVLQQEHGCMFLHMMSPTRSHCPISQSQHSHMEEGSVQHRLGVWCLQCTAINGLYRVLMAVLVLVPTSGHQIVKPDASIVFLCAVVCARGAWLLVKRAFFSLKHCTKWFKSPSRWLHGFAVHLHMAVLCWSFLPALPPRHTACPEGVRSPVATFSLTLQQL